jgi:NAD/NADP transhydrogenase beta subunit
MSTATGTNASMWVDDTWLETVIVIGITCFILCLMKLSKVTTAKMGMVYGMIGMALLILGYWFNTDYTYGSGIWIIAASMAPGIVVGLVSAISVEITTLPELVGAYVRDFDNTSSHKRWAILRCSIYESPN